MSMSISATIAPEALAARFQTRPFKRMRQVRGVLSDRPRTPTSVAVELRVGLNTVRGMLCLLAEAGLALRIGEDRYIARGPARPVLTEAQVPLEVGRQILACLTEPRRPREIAARIGRSGSCTTVHLRHLMRRGLVVRIEPGVYALAARGSAPSGSAPGRIWSSEADAMLRVAPKGEVAGAVFVAPEEDRILRDAFGRHGGEPAAREAAVAVVRHYQQLGAGNGFSATFVSTRSGLLPSRPWRRRASAAIGTRGGRCIAMPATSVATRPSSG